MPTKLRLLRGNPGKRPLNRREPTPEPGRPGRPGWLTGLARAEWDRVVPELERLGVLARIDRAALAAYCQTWADWIACVRFVAEHGAVVVLRDDKGQVKWTQPAPQMALGLKLAAQLRAFAAEFGLTPASRSRVSAAPQPHANPARELLFTKPAGRTG